MLRQNSKSYKKYSLLAVVLMSHLSRLSPALEALFRIAVSAICDGAKSSPASVMAACVRKSSALFLSDSGFSSMGYLV